MIVFTNVEVARAIAAYRRSRNSPLPAGDIVDVVLGAAPEIYVHGHVVDPHTGHSHEFRLEGTDLGAAMIMYCLNERIPLPASNNTKRLQLFGESLGLVVHINAPSGSSSPYI